MQRLQEEVAQHVQTATELDHAMETLKNKVDQVNTDKAQPNYTEASTDKKSSRSSVTSCRIDYRSN